MLNTTRILGRRLFVVNADKLGVRNLSSEQTGVELARQRRSLAGRVAICSGATDGMGYTMAERLAIDGAHVVVSSRNQKNVDQAVAKMKEQGLAVSGMTCNVGSPEDRKKLIESTVAEFGGFDILISNAAVNPQSGRIMTCTEQTWDRIFDVNVKSQFFFVKESVPHLEKRNGRGSIILISSIGAYAPIAAKEFLGAYALSKTSLLGLTKILAQELGEKGIRVNCICPGLIETRFGDILVNDKRMPKIITTATCLKRNGRPEEIAGLAAFLASDDASYVTGENICVAGGAPSPL